MAAPYTQDDLESMLADLESDRVERKESLQGDAPRKIRQAVCAFANDLPDHRRAGIVFVGVDDGGAPAGLEITDELLLQLADVKTDGNIVPPPTLTVNRHVLLGTPVGVITVMPSDTPPVRHRGWIWIRVGPRRVIASARDERILNEKRRHRDRWAKQMPAEYSRSVLDETPAEALDPQADAHCIATVKHYRSLIPLARDARKPVFSLSAGDGALGAHAAAARGAFDDFKALVENILERTGHDGT